MGQQEFQRVRKIGAIPEEILRKLPANDVRPVFPQPGNAPGVEGLDAVYALVAFQHVAGRLGELCVIAVLRLQLNDEGNLSVYQRQDVQEFWDGILRVFQAVVFQVLRIQVFDAPGLPGGAVKKGIVHHAKVAVF